MSFGQKIEHIWEYYRLQIIGIVVILILIVYFVFKALNGGASTYVSAVFIGGDQEQANESTLLKDFILDNGLNPKSQEVTPTYTGNMDFLNGSTGYNEYQLLSALFLSGDVDVMVAAEDVTVAFAVNGALADLTKILTPEMLEKYKDSLVYVNTSEDGEKYPCGINIDTGNKIYNKKVCVSIANNSVNQEESILLMTYLLEN